MKDVAIIIGHRERSQGAYSPTLNKTEFQFNKKVALFLEDIADIYERPNIPFVSEAFRIKELVKEVNKKSYRLVISLHFNSFENDIAHGATALYYITNSKGKHIATEFVKIMADDFGIKKRDLIPISNKNQRGGTLITGLHATSILVEPFFGSNEEDALKFKDQEEKYAQLLRSLIAVTKNL